VRATPSTIGPWEILLPLGVKLGSTIETGAEGALEDFRFVVDSCSMGFFNESR
jgi:hypothetical protein